MGLTPVFKPLNLNIAKEVGLILALLISIGWVWQTNGLPGDKRREILLRKELRQMFYMVVAILMFKQIMQDSHAVNTISTEMLRLRIPLFAIAVVLPMLVGLVCGITIAFVGRSFSDSHFADSFRRRGPAYAGLYDAGLGQRIHRGPVLSAPCLPDAFQRVFQSRP